MEFNTWNNTDMFNYASPVPGCMHEFNNGLTLAFNLILLICIANRVFGWCRDPLNVELQQKVKDLENENDNLVEQVSELKEEYNTISSKLRRANESLDNLRNVLEINRPVETDTSSDTQG